MNKIEGVVVVVDDDRDVLLSARLYLSQYFDAVFEQQKPTDLLPFLSEKRADVVLMDMNYKRGRDDGSEGLRLLKQIKNERPETEVVVMTAYADVELAVEAIKAGACDFVVKPWSNEKLLATVMNAMRLSKSNAEIGQLKRHQAVWKKTHDDLPEMIGDGPRFQSIRNTIAQVAVTDANVLVLGENGTGKEVVARHIHHQSLRKDEPFVKVDLGAIHENLFEAELFGAKKGAYTDLKQDREGHFAMADKGTLFLDEIANLSLPLQAKLLSVLENRRVIPVGETKAKEIDVRLICATNAKLIDWLKEGRFREDLFYRINTIEIEVPPLRERPEDLPQLLRYYLNLYNRKYKRNVKLDPAALPGLQSYSWPGNIRELRHSIERAVILTQSDKLGVADLIQRPESNSASEIPSDLNELERWQVQRIMDKHRGNISRAARELGITRAALYRRLEKHELE